MVPCAQPNHADRFGIIVMVRLDFFITTNLARLFDHEAQFDRHA
jgi:hypothetical protein